MNIRRAKQLQIKAPQNRIFYGGDQSWFSSNTHALGGCGSVAGANSLRALARCDEDFRNSILSSKKMPKQLKSALCDERPGKDDFELLMTGIYKTMGAVEIFPLNYFYDKSSRDSKLFKYLRPSFGQSNTGFIIGMIRFARKFGLDIAVRFLPASRISEDRISSFIDRGLENSGAVVMLTSYNKHSLKMYPSDSNLENALSNSYDSYMKQHFATITDIDEDRVLLTTWGKPAVASYEELLQSWRSFRSFESTLFYLVPSSRRESNICLLMSWFPFVKAILQTLFGGR